MPLLLLNIGLRKASKMSPLSLISAALAVGLFRAHASLSTTCDRVSHKSVAVADGRKPVFCAQQELTIAMEMRLHLWSYGELCTEGGEGVGGTC